MKKKPTGMTGGKPREKIKTLSRLKKDLWELTKQIIRAEYGNTCYTCGQRNLSGSNWHTSHFIPKSICSAELAYSLDNLRPSCYQCNIHLSGNWVAFEAHLKQEEGDEFTDSLKKRNQETKGKLYGRDWYLKKIEEYAKILEKICTQSTATALHSAFTSTDSACA